ncbi:hypothetical protein ACIRQF_22080 [Streptomyces sp. NPDC101191]|uniref:hypothetical protein n=1 Tax=Streptomyces sp. NPDC101191 TaxID=3366126 RepID=UPI003815CA18
MSLLGRSVPNLARTAPDTPRALAEQAFAKVADGTVTLPVTAELPLERAAGAHRLMGSRTRTGKPGLRTGTGKLGLRTGTGKRGSAPAPAAGLRTGTGKLGFRTRTSTGKPGSRTRTSTGKPGSRTRTGTGKPGSRTRTSTGKLLLKVARAGPRRAFRAAAGP